jgi:hypothetical protein
MTVLDERGTKSGDAKVVASAALVLASVHKCLRICDLCKELGIFVSTRILQRSGSGKLRATPVWCLCAR